MSPQQRTLNRPVELEGVGVHSGEHATIRISGAETGSGIRFRRSDVAGSPPIPAILDNVVDTDLGTTLGLGEVRVQTVEHVMAALAACRIDNADVEITGPEPPILDGDFRAYTDVFTEAILEQDEPAAEFRLPGPFRFSLDEDTKYETVPQDEFCVSATIEFDHPSIGRQQGHFRVGESFLEEIAAARTFGFQADADLLRARGLALGASLENTVVLDDDGVMNGELYFPDEFLRHKVGDIVGDLALLGGRIKGLVVAERPSHKGNIELARALEARARQGQESFLDIEQLMAFLPHRYPMLLVDRIIDFEPGKRIVGLKNVTINEPFFQGHFPGHPIMPGVLLIEAMAQAGGLLLMEAEDEPENKVVYFVAIDNVKFRKPVRPGDQVVFELELVRYKRRICKMRGIGKVDGQTVVEGDLMASVVDR
jgi:UDP-3-O-[3-hydroxymyristoyl] N-acetylglucosamine deacetylase / 3-hydroxyacyl-[acyl-carrier-protein] dehydratase